MQQHPSVVLDSLSFSFDDGTEVFHDLSATFPSGVTGIIGSNGLGKSVLMRLVAGELTPSGGTVSAPRPVAVLPQRLTLASDQSVAGLLGAEAVIAAIDELTTTEPTPERAADLMEVIGDDWDAADAALASLAAAGLPHLAAVPGILTRRVGTLSGGEAMAIALAGLRRSEPALTLLDEPTNNLDQPAREALIASLKTWPGTVLVVSHDRALLRAVETIAELRPRRVRAGRADGVVLELFGGGWDDYASRRAAEREAAERTLRGAEATAAKQVQARQAAQTATARTAAQGKKAAASMPKILANTRKNAAEATAGKSAAAHQAKVDSAREAVLEAREALREVGTIDIGLPGSGVGRGVRVLESERPDLPGKVLLDDGVPVPLGAPLEIRGPERIALRGRNGAGKSTLLEAILPGAAVPVGVLRQRTGTGASPAAGGGSGEEGHPGDDAASGTWGGFDDYDSVLSNLLRAVPGLTEARAREVTGRLNLRGARVAEPYGRLSGGERFRVDLARILGAAAPPRLLVLDEPTNDLDLASVEELAGALAGFEGALIVVSHDDDFLAEIGVSRTWEIVDEGEAGLHDVPEADDGAEAEG